MLSKLILFDCDETLWTSAKADYISSVVSPLRAVRPDVIERVQDGATFTLKTSVVETFSLLAKYPEVAVGVVSDNRPQPVIDALRLFGLWGGMNPGAVNVRLWQGYCPKQLMVREVMLNPEFAHVHPKDVYLIDDKDYSKGAGEIGITFIQVTKATNLYDILKELL